MSDTNVKTEAARFHKVTYHNKHSDRKGTLLVADCTGALLQGGITKVASSWLSTYVCRAFEILKIETLEDFGFAVVKE